MAVYKYAPKRGKPGKQIASRRFRRTTGLKDVPDGGWYKKVYCSYDIHDWIADMRFGDMKSWLPRGAKKTKKGWMMPK